MIDLAELCGANRGVRVSKAVGCLTVGLFGLPALADTLVSGAVSRIYTDPSDVVLMLSVPGPCGSSAFTIPRTNVNFKEFYAAMLMALVSSKGVAVNVTSCSGDGNIVSHGSIIQ